MFAEHVRKCTESIQSDRAPSPGVLEPVSLILRPVTINPALNPRLLLCQ